jgi:hypothetical protein
MQQPLRHFGIHVAGRFVGNEQVGPVDHCTGDGDALLLATGKRRRPGAGPVCETDPGKHFAHRTFDLLVAATGNPQRQGNIIERRQVADQPEVLKDDTDLSPIVWQRLARRFGEFVAE